MRLKMFEWILDRLGVKEQLREDLAKIVAVVTVFVAETESAMGAGDGAKKKKAALDALMESIEEEGGINLPSWCTGTVARKVLGLVIDYAVALANGGKPKAG